MMVRGLNARLVKSGSTTRRLSEAAIRALQAGDVEALLAINRAEFGGFRMEDGGDDDGSGDDTGDKGDTGDSGTDDDNDDDDDDDDDTSGDDDKSETVSKAELDAALKRMKAADQRAAKAEAELKKINDGKKSDLERTQSELEEVKTENQSLREQLQSERLNNGFLGNNKITWHNPSAALKLAQSEGYLADVVDEDGNVDGKALGSALKKLAADHSYLVKRDGSGSSGDTGPGRSNNGKDDKATKDADRRRAPALARRR